MGGGGSSNTPTTTTQSTTSSQAVSNPWSGIQRNLLEAVGGARGLANQPYSQFPYSWQTGMPFLNVADAYQIDPYSIYQLQGLLNQPGYNYTSPGSVSGVMGNYYQGNYPPGSTGKSVGSIYPAGGTGYQSFSWPSASGDIQISGGSPYYPTSYGGYGYSPQQTTATGMTSGTPTQSMKTTTGTFNPGTPSTEAELAGKVQGYYQNFLTGQAMPYTNYLPYTSQVAPLNTLQQMGLAQTAQIAAGGDPLAAGATRMLSDTLEGKYLDPSTNPYLRATYQAAADPTMQNYLNAVYPGLRSAASQAGQFGSSSDALLQGQAQYNLGKTLSDLGTGIYGQNYQAERANQLKGALEAPAISAEAFAYPQALVGAGTIYQQQAQNQISDMVNQWSQLVNYPWQMEQNYASVIGGLPFGGYGNTSGTTSGRNVGINPYYVSPAQQTMGTIGTLGGLGLGALSILL